MAKQPPLWKGSKDLEEAPESPKETYTLDGITVERTYYGPRDVCRAKKPTAGQSMADYPTLIVDKVQILPAKGGKAQMIVSLSSLNAGESEGPEQPTWEVEYVVLERRLEQHPIYQPGGSNALTFEDLAQLKAWAAGAEDHPDRYYQFEFQTAGAGDWTGLSANATHLAQKKIRGQETYQIFAPVARINRKVSSLPSTQRTGRRKTPPGFPSLPSGYEWLVTADRATRTGRFGKWDWSGEYTGADFWDPDLYPSG